MSKRPMGESQSLSTIPTKRSKVVKSRRGKGTPELYSKGQVFPDVFHTTLRYSSNMVAVTSVAASTTFQSVRLNSIYDFDNSNFLGDKQPLYYDTLVNSTGPFRAWKVMKWRTKIQVMNSSSNSLLVYWTQGGDTSEGDTLIEVQNRPNVRELILSPKGGDNDSGFITAPGSMAEIFGQIINPESALGGVASNPLIVAYGTLFFSNPGGTSSTLIDCWVKVTHDFDTELSSIDGLISV